MRYLLLSLMLVGSTALAAPSFPRVWNAEVAVDNCEVKTLNISSHTYKSVLDSSAFTSVTNVWGAEVYNLAGSSSTINCSFSVSLSTIAQNANYGREVPAGVGMLWQTDFNKNTLYCKTQNVAGVTRATVTLCK